MIKYIKKLWSCKIIFIKVWIFFFAISLCGNSPYGIVRLLLNSCAAALLIIALGVLIEYYREYKR